MGPEQFALSWYDTAMAEGAMLGDLLRQASRAQAEGEAEAVVVGLLLRSAGPCDTCGGPRPPSRTTLAECDFCYLSRLDR